MENKTFKMVCQTQTYDTTTYLNTFKAEINNKNKPEYQGQYKF